ncbi:uncharacterized protein [Haliotis cracherodii]|uniref:uncharacterized protein n=1 Tax=Haliotis cracherodii TaxID=6455 RepID=UPI0039E95195
MDQVEQASAVDHQLEELKLGILSLVNNRLSPLLISEETLHQTILHLTKLLSSSRPNFVLLQRDPSFYFSQGQFIYTRAGDRLYVSIKFPISSFGKPLHLYKMISLPVPVNETSLHSTQLISIPSYFAVSEDNQHYVTLSDTQVSTCIGRSILHCPYRISLTPVTVPSCELALFQNNRAQVKHLCDFRYVTKTHPPTLLEIDHSTVLIYRIPTLSLTCPSVQRMIPGCSFCLLKSPCSCALSTESIFFPASFSSCTNSTTHLTRLHPVNLALLQHFFDDSTLSAIAGDTTFKRAISITNIPQFHLYSHNFSHFLARDNQDHLSLKRMVASAKKDETVFQNLAEPLLDGEINIPNSWPDTNAFIVIASTIMSSFSVILVIWLFLKLRSLTTALALLTNARPIHSLQPPSFDYKQLMPTTSKPDSLSLPDLTERETMRLDDLS